MAVPNIRWDTDTATVALVLAALVFLWLARSGFRGRLGA